MGGTCVARFHWDAQALYALNGLRATLSDKPSVKYDPLFAAYGGEFHGVQEGSIVTLIFALECLSALGNQRQN